MIELDSLKFSVDTSELVKAITEVGNLQKAVSNLNKPLAENARISAKAAKESAGVAIAEEKVAQAKAKTLAAESRATAAKERAEKATDRLIKKETEQISVLERQQNIYNFMTQGYSKGQATVLAQAKAQGALGDELERVGKILNDQRKLLGGDPFDKSISGLTSLRNAMRELKDEQRTFTAGIEMTSKQYKEFARDKLRIIEVAKAEGASLSELKQRLRDHGAEYVKLTTEVNRLANAEKARERAQRDQLNAARSIAAEDEKMTSIMKSLNAAQADHSSLSDRAARSIANYERNLRIAGITGEKAAVKLEQYRKSVMAVQQAEKQRQIDMLSRSLAPQISDVAVSLASGMNPLTVALQQGLQIRDLIGLSGVAVEDLQKSFKNAAADMVSSLRGTAAALGSLFIGAIVSAGDAVVNFGSKITGTNILFDKFRQSMTYLFGETSNVIKAVDVMGKAFAVSAGVTVAAAAAGFIAYLVALKQVVSEQNELSRSLALTGASLGLTKDQAITLAQSIDGISESKGVAVLNEMAKAGGFTKKQFEEVATAAVKLDKYFGISFEETVKNFKKLQGEPTKVLAEFAAQNGQIEISVLKQVRALEDQGKVVEATNLAVKAYSDSLKSAADIAERDLHPITKIWNDIKSTIGEAWEAMKEFARSDVIVSAFRIAFELVRNVVYDTWLAIKGIGGAIGTVIAVATELVTGGGLEGAANVIRAAKDDFKNALAEREKLMNPTKQSTTTSRDNREKNAADAEKFLRNLKKSRKDAEEEAKRLEKFTQTSIKNIREMSNGSQAVIENYTDIQKKALDIFSSEVFYDLTNSQKIAIRQELEKALAIEASMEVEKARQAIVQHSIKLQEEAYDAQQKINQDLISSNFALEKEIELIGLDEEAKARLTEQLRLEEIQRKKLALVWEKSIPDNEARVRQLEDEISALERRNELLGMQRSKEQFVAMRDSITDAVVTGLFEGGKAGSKKLRDIITAELRKPITVFIQAVVSDILGLGGIGGGGIGGFANTIQQGTNLLSNFINFNSNLGSNLAFAADNLGNWLVNNTSGFMNKAGGSLMQNANLIGDIGGALGGAFSGYGISKAISGGYQTGLGSTVDILGAVASAFVGPIGGAISGAVNRLFGRKLKDTGIEGTFYGDSGFSGNTYQFYKGGLFRSNKTVRNAIDPALASGLGQAYGSVTEANKQMAQYLGLDTGKLSGFSYGVNFSTQGMSEQQVQQKLQEVLLNAVEEQAKLLLGTFETVTTSIFGSGTISKNAARFFNLTKTTQVWKPSDFVREGETASEAMTRLYTSLKAVNSFLENTNSRLYEFSLVGADMASMLVDLLGGVENFNTVTSSYYQNFFTEQERVAKGQELLAQTFKELGIALPSTVTAYRQLVESQDLATESGRQTFASLMTLSSVFYELDTASREAVSTIVEEINRLRGVVGTSSLNGFAGTKATFLSTLAAAQAGDTTAKQSLPGLSQSLETMFAGTAGSLEDVNRFRSWLANSLSTVVPSFADGGIHEGGVRLVGENGPELEVTGPSRIFNAGDTAGMLSGGNVVDAIKVLNANLELLRAEVRADVQHNAKTAKLLDRVIPEGDSINISGTIDGGQL